MNFKQDASISGWGSMESSSMNQENNESNSSSKEKKKKKNKSGGFQSMGLCREVLNGVLQRGYKVPSPIQRKTIPMILQGRDVVAMARTGSGKTAAFLIPMFERLMKPSQRTGRRAIIMSPTRELAMQTLSFAKDLGKYTGLSLTTFLGGERLADQFARMHQNPDIIIATPGRFAHLCVEMNLQLDNVEYLVFDEADRLFEMGFHEQIQELMARLPATRQTLLFSATLPQKLVEFANAGLSEPSLVRLDTENKLSELLSQTFFRVNPDDRTSLLVHLVNHLLKRHSRTIVFAPTKQHVEYIHGILQAMKFASTYLYSALDQEARQINVSKFRSGDAEILVCTDIAARGIDVPSLDAVINFTFPSKPKLYVHRVGRVARAGKVGWAYSFLSREEMPYLIDLQFFLNKDVRVADKEEMAKKDIDINMLIGVVPPFVIDEQAEYVEKLIHTNSDLEYISKGLKSSLEKYNKTKEPPSKSAVFRIKEELWGSEMGYHPALVRGENAEIELKRYDLLDRLKNLQPKKTIFEVGVVGQGKASQSSAVVEEFIKRNQMMVDLHQKNNDIKKERVLKQEIERKIAEEQRNNITNADESFIVETFNVNSDPTDFQKKNFSENCYSVSAFKKQAASCTLDLMGDDEEQLGKDKQMWDRRKKKFVTTASKKIKTESGHKISASYKKDIYERWKHGKEQVMEEIEPVSSKTDQPRKRLTVMKSHFKKAKMHGILQNEKQPENAKSEVHQLDKRLNIRKRQNKKRAFVRWRKDVNSVKRKKHLKEVRKKMKRT